MFDSVLLSGINDRAVARLHFLEDACDKNLKTADNVHNLDFYIITKRSHNCLISSQIKHANSTGAKGLILLDFEQKPAFDELSIHAAQIKDLTYRTYLIPAQAHSYDGAFIRTGAPML